MKSSNHKIPAIKQCAYGLKGSGPEMALTSGTAAPQGSPGPVLPRDLRQRKWLPPVHIRFWFCNAKKKELEQDISVLPPLSHSSLRFLLVYNFISEKLYLQKNCYQRCWVASPKGKQQQTESRKVEWEVNHPRSPHHHSDWELLSQPGAWPKPGHRQSSCVTGKRYLLISWAALEIRDGPNTSFGMLQ